MRYFDTSVIVAAYVPERASVAAQAALSAERRRLVCDLTRAEFASALSRRVRERSISRQDAARVLEQFQKHIEDGVYEVVALGREQYDLAYGYLAQMTTALRTLDALHCAMAMRLAVPLVTADKPLAMCAHKLGIRVELLA